MVATTVVKPPPGCSFDGKKMLVVNYELLTFLYYDGDTDDIWMPARSVMRITREKDITKFLNRIHIEDKMSFEDLVETKGGIPSEEHCGLEIPLRSHQFSNEIWLSESGFTKGLLSAFSFETSCGDCNTDYEIFQRWVTKEVLPLIRKKKTSNCDKKIPSRQRARQKISLDELIFTSGV